MKFPFPSLFLSRRRSVLFWIGILVVALVGGAAYAINILSEGYRLNSNTTTVIDATSVGGDCKSVVTPNDGKDRFIPTKTVAEWNSFKSAAAWDGITLNSCVTGYPGCDTPDITLANGQVWAACNVGATVAYVGQAYPSNTVPTAGQKAYMGGYFQWGRNDDVTANTSTPTLAPAGTLAGGVGHSNFITTEDIDWILTPNDNLWGGGTTTNTSGTFATMTAGNQVAMKGPCATGYHVPTQKEWCDAVVSVTGNAWCDAVAHNDATLRSTLKLPLSGIRFNDTGSYNWQGWWGYYWASSPIGTEGYSAVVSATQVTPAFNITRAHGFSVRCLKDPPVTTYPGCDTSDITLANGQVWAACNVGAKYAYAWQAYPVNTATRTQAQKDWMGALYQWGRNKDITTEGTTAGPVSSDVTTNFITSSIAPWYDWLTPENSNLWGDPSSSWFGNRFSDLSLAGQTLAKGPCASWYHIPTGTEWCNAVTLFMGACSFENFYSDTSFRTTLKLPLAGQRWIAGEYYEQGETGYYWAASSNWPYYGIIMPIITGGFDNVAPYYRAAGLSVRCLKDPTPTAFPLATSAGWTITTSGNYRIHTFTSNGTFVASGSWIVEYLVVGGGGGGSFFGGGGAGGFRTGSYSVTAGAINVIVGAGGAADTNGGDSTFGSITSIGGGRNGYPGGSGGGGREGVTAATGPIGFGSIMYYYAGASGTPGQGYPGGTSTYFYGSDGDRLGGGGGGAGGPGIDVAYAVSNSGEGGIGLQSSISGTATYYAGGGGGFDDDAEDTTSYPLYGGLGGGGHGGRSWAWTSDREPQNGAPNTGGGGGGGYKDDYVSFASGGSGIVIIRYQYQ